MLAAHRRALAAAKRDYDELGRKTGDLARRLAVVREDRRRARATLGAIMAAARASGMTWAQIGESLGGISAQAASQMHRRYAPRR